MKTFTSPVRVLSAGAFAVIAATASPFGAASAATVAIDSFTTAQTVTAPFAGASSVTTTTAAAEAIGGARTITAVRTNPASPTAQTAKTNVTAVADGEALVSFAAQSKGYSTFEWSLGAPVDLIDGTNTRIDLDILDFDLAGIEFTLGLNGISRMQTVTSIGTLSFLFSDFAGLDASAVNLIRLTVAGPQDFDVAFGPIAATGDLPPVPLPAGGLLLTSALAGAVALRRRKG